MKLGFYSGDKKHQGGGTRNNLQFMLSLQCACVMCVSTGVGKIVGNIVVDKVAGTKVVGKIVVGKFAGTKLVGAGAGVDWSRTPRTPPARPAGLATCQRRWA
jgi:hypothetical protein